MMKKIVLMVSVVAALSPSAHATCVAIEHDEISYGSTKNYQVRCGNDSFETKKRFTHYLIVPVPRASEVAYNHLTSTMTEKGYQQVASLDVLESLRGWEGSSYVFERDVTQARYASVLISAKTANAGFNQNQTVMDVIISIGSSSQLYQGITDAQLTQLMSERGFRKAVEVNVARYVAAPGAQSILAKSLAIFKSE